MFEFSVAASLQFQLFAKPAMWMYVQTEGGHTTPGIEREWFVVILYFFFLNVIIVSHFLCQDDWKWHQ